MREFQGNKSHQQQATARMLEVARLQHRYLTELELVLAKLIKTPAQWQLVEPKRLHELVQLSQCLYDHPQDASKPVRTLVWLVEQ